MFNVYDFANKMNITIKDTSLYELAFTHPSCNVNQNNKHQDYERLEFIGDSVLGFVCADLVYKMHPEMDEGLLSKLRSSLVRKESLAKYARNISLYKYVKVGHSINKNTIISSNKILEDVFEAVIGAIYIDLGFEVACKYVSSFLLEDVKNANPDDLTDYKSKLQELMQSEQRETVTYQTVLEEGPAHNKTFTVNVLHDGIVLGTGKGKSKKIAEEFAAKDALSKGI